MCCVPYGKFEEQEKILQELVDKSIPKKLRNITNHYIPETYEYNYSSANCPNCNKDISFDEYYQPNYCSECGQKLDLSEDDEKI